MSNAVATKPRNAVGPLVPESEMNDILALDQTAKAASAQLIQAERDGNDMAKGLIMAKAMTRLRQLLTEPVMRDVMQLMNTPLGFRTDKDPARGEKDEKGNWVANKPYPMEVVRDVIIQALIRGLRPTGNEINIIAGNLYVTKEGFERLLREFPGLTKLQVEIGVPVNQGDGALVPAKASWSIGGQQDMIVCEKGTDADYRIPIRVNKAMGIDAIQGKAKSKLFRRIYERLTGTALGLEEPGDDSNTIDGQVIPPTAPTNTKQAPGS